MRIIIKKKIHEFAAIHPNSRPSLEIWYKIIKGNFFTNFAILRKIFPSADQVKNLTVFNISGNHYRLIAAIHYNSQIVYIREILTHAEYDRSKWR